MKNGYTIVYSQDAKDDIKDIYSYIAYKLLVPSVAKKQVNEIRNAIHSLNSMPARYQIIDREPWKSKRLHKLLINKYIVFYLVHDDTKIVEISRIIYSGRDIEGIL